MTGRAAAEINAQISKALASWPSLDEPHLISRHDPASYIESPPYFQEAVKPSGIVDMVMFFLMYEPTHFSGFGISRRERQGIFTEREIEIGKLLLPHLRCAVTISKVLMSVPLQASGWPKRSMRSGAPVGQ